MRAYAELESAGLVASRRGAGTVVRSSAVAPADRLAALTDDFVGASRAVGADDEAIRTAVDTALGTGRAA